VILEFSLALNKEWIEEESLLRVLITGYVEKEVFDKDQTIIQEWHFNCPDILKKGVLIGCYLVKYSNVTGKTKFNFVALVELERTDVALAELGEEPEINEIEIELELRYVREVRSFPSM
jgi:hypothetical protein